MREFHACLPKRHAVASARYKTIAGQGLLGCSGTKGSFESLNAFKESASVITKELFENISQEFPIRGKASCDIENNLRINIGSKVGVRPGMKFDIIRLTTGNSELQGNRLGRLGVMTVQDVFELESFGKTDTTLDNCSGLSVKEKKLEKSN